MLVNGSELVKRLVACGWTASSAEDICQRYAAAGDFSGLETFIKQMELLYDDRKEYAYWHFRIMLIRPPAAILP